MFGLHQYKTIPNHPSCWGRDLYARALLRIFVWQPLSSKPLGSEINFGERMKA